MRSLPVRERGSKHRVVDDRKISTSRSPCGSVDRNVVVLHPYQVAQRRSPCGSVDRNSASAGGEADGCVAPRAGAWIETPTHRPPVQTAPSLPVRERGSKHHDVGVRIAMRLVAPRAGAWIETTGSRHPRADAEGRSPCGSVDRNSALYQQRPAPETVAPRAGAWIETKSLGRTTEAAASRSPCGSVDRNPRGYPLPEQRQWSLPVRERGSKQRLGPSGLIHRGVAPRAGAWIETRA